MEGICTLLDDCQLAQKRRETYAVLDPLPAGHGGFEVSVASAQLYEFGTELCRGLFGLFHTDIPAYRDRPIKPLWTVFISYGISYSRKGQRQQREMTGVQRA